MWRSIMTEERIGEWTSQFGRLLKEIKRGQACIKPSIFWSPMQGFPTTELWLINTRKLPKHQEKITHLCQSFPCVSRISNTSGTKERVRSDSDSSDWWSDLSPVTRSFDHKHQICQAQTVKYCTLPVFYQHVKIQLFPTATFFDPFVFILRRNR